MENERTFINVSGATLHTLFGDVAAFKLIADEHIPTCTQREAVERSITGEVLGHINTVATFYPFPGMIVGPGGIVLSR